MNKDCPQCACFKARQQFEKLLFRQDPQSVLQCSNILALAKISPLMLLKYCTEVVYSKVALQKTKHKENRNRKI